MLRTVPVLDGRLVKRANSCLAIGDPGVPLDEAATRVDAFYAARDRPVLAQVEAGSEVDAALSAAGWVVVPGGDADFLMASLSRALRSCNALLSRDSAAPAGCEDTRTARYSEVGGGRVRVEVGDGIATGEAALDGDWLGLHGLVVADEHRRAGAGYDGARGAAGVGSRAGRDHGLAARRGRQHAGAGALRAGGLPRAPRAAATCARAP